LVLSQPGFLFLLGVSRDVIEQYLHHKYKENYGIRGFQGSDYLDKIIQLSFDIPRHTSRMNVFATKLIEKLEDNSDKKQLLQITNVMGVACNNNPRTVVRFINRLLIDQAIYASLPKDHGKANPVIAIGYFAITRSLQQQWKSIYSLLTSPDEMINNKLCEAIAKWQDKDIEKWKNVDLDKLGVYSSQEIQANKKYDLEGIDPKSLQECAIALSDNNLKQLLLLSEIGKNWLEHDELRKITIEFIVNQPSVIQVDKEELENLNLEAGELEADIFLSVPIFANFSNREQYEKDLKFYYKVQKALEQGGKRKVFTSIDFDLLDRTDFITHESISKIFRSRFYVLVLPKIYVKKVDSFFIELNFAVSQHKPILCYLEKGAALPLSLITRLKSRYITYYRYNNTEELFDLIAKIDKHFYLTKQ
jgi:KAP-like P-loop domain-containing protein